MRFRVSGINVALAVLTAAAGIGVLVFFPDAPNVMKGLAIVGVAAIALAIALTVRYALTRDFQRLAMWAGLRGWTFSGSDASLRERFHVYPFGSGIGGRVDNVLRGTYRFHECVTFTYSTAKPAPQFYQVTLVELDADIPAFELLPEDAIAAAAKLVGGQDLKVGDKTFDDRWRISAMDPDFVMKILNSRLRHRLDRKDIHGMPIAGDGRAILTWQAGPAGVRRMSHRLDVLIAVAEAIPDELWKVVAAPRRF